MRRLWPLSLILMFACKPSEGDASAEATKSAEPADAEPKTDAKPEAKPEARPSAHTPDAAEHAPKPKPDEARDLRRKLVKLLNEGRALTKKGSYTEGMAKYREALEIDASDVAVLGELGWAAYKSGDLELAHSTTVGALKFVREDKRRGMLLYNLGRVEEDRAKVDAAIEHYRGSLAARPGNKIVQGRLDALLAAKAEPAAPVVAADQYTALEVLGRDLGDLAAACELIRTARCEDYAMDEGDTCTCEPELVAAPGADQSWGLLAFANQGFPSQAAWFPVVQTDKGWTAFAEVLYEYNPGAFGIFEEVEIGTSTIEPLLAKGAQLVMHLSKDRMDRDMGFNEIEQESHSVVVICARHETGAYCTRPLLDSYQYSRDVDFDDPEDPELAEIEHEGLVPPTGFVAMFEFEDAQLSVVWTDTRGGYDEMGERWESNGWVLAAGKYPLAMLLGLPTSP